jgi:glc operon protein GlcG
LRRGKPGEDVRRGTGTAIVLLAALLAATGAARSQQPATPAAPAQNPLDVVPEKMPFNTPYGAPISLQKAEDAIHAASRKPTGAAGR